ncbi:MAG: T9SS type A sorting domain-containing protein [Bacteroidales bacterium]|nr:T9SS type A sorting domain-containing protein [Bacteroidales bacterium]
MKTKALTSLLLLAAVSLFAQPRLSFNLQKVDDQTNDNGTLVYEISLKADEAGSYHCDLQMYLDYNTEAFGENIVRNSKVKVTPGELLSGSFAGAPMYRIVNVVDNTSSRIAIITEALFPEGNVTDILNEVTENYKSLLRVEVATGFTGAYMPFSFCEKLMNEGQYFREGTEPEKYTFPCKYEYNVEVREISQLPDELANKTTASLNGITAWPNPVSNLLNVAIPQPGNYSVMLVDLLGQEQFSTKLTPEQKLFLTIDMTGRKAGIYMLHIKHRTEGGLLKVIKK